MTGETKTYIDQPMMLETTPHLRLNLIYIHQKVYNSLCMGLAPIMDQPIMKVIILVVVCLLPLGLIYFLFWKPCPKLLMWTELLAN